MIRTENESENENMKKTRIKNHRPVNRPVNAVLIGALLLSLILAIATCVLAILNADLALLLTIGISNIILTGATLIATQMLFIRPLKRIGAELEQITHASRFDPHRIPRQASEVLHIENNVIEIRHSVQERLHPSIELEKKRKILLTSICHDLRTPLTSLMGYVEALQDDVGDRSANLNIIYERAEFINKLIDDLDVYAKNDLNQLEVYRKRVLVNELLSACVRGIGDPRIRLVEPVVKAFVYADPYRIRQVLENILGNSAKHARSVISVETSIDETYYTVRICDDGEGIAEQYRDKIFDPFFMVQKNANGTGLGLAISKNLMEAHEGSIELAEDSTLGGADFLVKIPIAR